MNLVQLKNNLDGEFYYDHLLRVLYATDASVYRELPLAVALPKNVQDLKHLILFAIQNKTSLIPRAAGTSLAGQCVGDGIVVDISKNFTKILDFNKKEKWVRVQPGVVRDELNAFLKPHGLFFSPITSTANRATIGGMVGNNSCGTTSIVYGSTREHVLEMTTILADGSEVVFGETTKSDFDDKLKIENLEGSLYKHVFEVLQDVKNKNNIRKHFPKVNIHRRNTGYALDYLLNSEIFSESEEPFNFCKLLCGSEGTLAFTTEVKLNLDELPLPDNVVLAAHFNTIDESLRATQIAMKHQPTACELMDKIILDCTKENIGQRKNRFFVEGDPQVILMVEFRGETILDAENQASELIQDFKNNNLGYAFPIIPAEKTKQVWKLRSAGLGLLANIPGDKKAVACIEDTAVAIDDLPNYIAEFSEMMKGYGQRSVYYAHAGAGEIHLRPILNLKKSEDVKQFYKISKASAELVKKYNGSLSGEHGDGRVRAAFIPLMVGDENYQLFCNIKNTWDPNSIFNPGKIVNAAPMNTSLRYEPEQKYVEIKTIFDYSKEGGILRAAEKCNGSGDCRKLPVSGGTMCPSYQATRNEKETTRGRANILREFLTKSKKDNPFDHPEIKEVMDLCLSCKGCTSECPSNVDMSSLRAEFLHQYYQTNGIPLRARAFAYINNINHIGGVFPKLFNFFLTNSILSGITKKALGIASQRSLPIIHSVSLREWYKKNYTANMNSSRKVYLFCDEFTNWNDTEIGIKSLKLLATLGYNVEIVDHPESGRASISKGLLTRAQKIAKENVSIFSKIVNSETPLIGVEPSAILSFRDEYPRLMEKDKIESANELAENCFLIDEFLSSEIKNGKINSDLFTKEKKDILLHGHCHQKALSNIEDTIWLLSLPQNYSVEVIPSGCCGMAGSFGYEKEHYEISQQIGNLVLFPKVKNAKTDVEIVAPGTSCRHQILEGTGKNVKHPVEVLYDAIV